MYLRPPPSTLFPYTTLFRSLGEDLVLDVRDVADVGDLVAATLQPAHQHIEGQEGAQVAQVRRALGGRPADVQRHRPFSHGDQRCGPAGGGVMQLEVHALQGTAPAGTIRAGPGKTYSVRPPLADRPLSCCGS